jgi:opacity protein-like surface antigen
MRNVLIAAALVALAGSACAASVKMPNGAVKHTWFVLDYRDASCNSDPVTPEQFSNDPLNYSFGLKVDRIAPADVEKDGDGNVVHVKMHGTLNDNPTVWDWFTSKGACQNYINANSVGPAQAAHDDIN